jgi:ketosteroid isomerase-like protein
MRTAGLYETTWTEQERKRILRDVNISPALSRMRDRKKTDHMDRSKISGGDNMNISRRHLTGPLPILGLVAFGLLGAKAAQAMSADEEAVAKRLDAFRVAQVAADAKAFEELCAPELSYSHSDGHVEDKATFIKNATAGKSKMLSLVYQDASIRIVGDVAIVRFHWLGESESVADSKKSSTNLHILTNWQKQGGEWKLLTRASTKL